MRHARLCFLFAAVAAMTGCDELDKNGRLDNGEFQYECVASGDAGCNGTDAIFGFDLDRELQPIAVAGRFSLKFDSDLTADSAEELSAAASDFVRRVSDNAFAFTEPVTVDFLAKNDQHEVVDFVDFTALAPDGLAVFSNGGPTSTISLDSYGELIIAAAPTSKSQVLIGGFDFSWTASGSGLELEQAPASEENTGSNVARIRAESSDATIVVTVTAGDLSGSATVIVGQGTSSSSGTGGGPGGSGGVGVGGLGGAGGSGGSAGSGGAGGTGGS